MSRGYFGIGVYHPKREVNIGLLWRHASLFEASFIFTIGRRYTPQAADTMRTERHTPLYEYESFEEFRRCGLPHGAPLVGVEMDPRARPLTTYAHPERAVYLLGAEDHGLPAEVRDACHDLVQIETPLPQSMNVGVAGTLVLNHRYHARRPVAARPLAVS